MLDHDTRQIRAKASFAEAIENLSSYLTAAPVFKPEDFLEEYTDKFLRLILALTAFNSRAKDWINQDVRIGFAKEDNELNEGFKPEWHHVFPRKLLKSVVDDNLVDAAANIVILNERANRSFSAKPPAQYLSDHGVRDERFDEQAVPGRELLVVERFQDFLKERANRLADRATTYLQGLQQQ